MGGEAEVRCFVDEVSVSYGKCTNIRRTYDAKSIGVVSDSKYILVNLDVEELAGYGDVRSSMELYFQGQTIRGELSTINLNTITLMNHENNLN